MMRIISAVNYGYRTVVRVCHNPDAPEWVHIIGDPVLDSKGFPVSDIDGLPRNIISTVVPDGETGKTCHNCRYNWDVTEIILDGDEQFSKDESGDLVRLTDDELAVVAFTRAAKPPTASMLIGLEGRDG